MEVRCHSEIQASRDLRVQHADRVDYYNERKVRKDKRLK